MIEVLHLNKLHFMEMLTDFNETLHPENHLSYGIHQYVWSSFFKNDW